ncbi:hypothetical protein KIPB_013108, partial [Kipferlia bialata]
ALGTVLVDSALKHLQTCTRRLMALDKGEVEPTRKGEAKAQAEALSLLVGGVGHILYWAHKAGHAVVGRAVVRRFSAPAHLPSPVDMVAAHTGKTGEEFKALFNAVKE